MSYLIFSTLEAAQLALQQIDANFRDAITAINPNAIDAEGLIGRNAATGELDPNAVRTETWCTPIECVEGWALIKPENLRPGVFDAVNLLQGVEGYAEGSITRPKRPAMPV